MTKVEPERAVDTMTVLRIPLVGGGECRADVIADDDDASSMSTTGSENAAAQRGNSKVLIRDVVSMGCRECWARPDSDR